MREHLIHRLLIQVLVVPPVAGHAIPFRCVWVMDPCDSPRMDALADAHRGIGWIAGDEIRSSAGDAGRPPESRQNHRHRAEESSGHVAASLRQTLGPCLL